MPLHLSSHDRRMLRGDAGGGARLAMRLVVKAAEIAGAPRLIDIGSAHVGSCYERRIDHPGLTCSGDEARCPASVRPRYL